MITNPPYWGLRDYGMTEQIGLEETVQEYIQKIVSLFREIKRVLKDDGTIWLNLGDAYAGSTVEELRMVVLIQGLNINNLLVKEAAL